MRMPHLELIYRIVAVMGPDSTSIPNTPNAGVSRLILPITGGSVRGPTIRGEIVRYSGADWAQRISSPKVLWATETLRFNSLRIQSLTRFRE